MKLENLKGRVIKMDNGLGVSYNRVLDVQGDMLKMQCGRYGYGFVFYVSAENLESGIASENYEIL